MYCVVVVVKGFQCRATLSGLVWKGFIVTADVIVIVQLQYRDRAKERRAKYGQPEPPLPKRSKTIVEPEPVP